MTIVELKEYICDNNKIEFILNLIGCDNIKYHSSKNHYSCSNIDGDNPSAITIYNTPYLNVVNYTRNMLTSINEHHSVPVDINADIITLVQFNTKKDFYTTIKYIHDILDIPFIATKKKETPVIKKDPLNVFKKYKSRNRVNIKEFDYSIYDEKIIREYLPYLHISWVKESITQRARDKFNIGYSSYGNRIIIPHRIWNGNDNDYIGIIGRTTVEDYDLLGIPKYFPFVAYQKSINLYGLQENYKAIKQAKRIIVFESEKSVLKRYSKFDETSVAIMGHSLSDEQIRILIGLDVEIIICMDKGIEEEYIKTMCKKFGGIRNVYYIFDKYDLLSSKMSPADASEKIYEFLIKHKIKYNQ